MENETWKPFANTESQYLISNLGRVKSLDRYKKSKLGSLSFLKGKILKPVLQKKTGYLIITIKYNGKVFVSLLHRAVAKHFIVNEFNKPCVNHINSIKTDNRVENLEWCTYKENIAHSFNNGLQRNKQKEFIGINLISGETITFLNIQDAAVAVVGNRGNIHKCLKSKNNRLSAYGYKWLYTKTSQARKRVPSLLNNIL